MNKSNVLEFKTSSVSVLSPPSSSSISKHWEAELAALKGNNAKLTAALLESTANVKQWKQQLAAYQEEAERLHKRVPVAAAVRELFPHPGEGSEGSRCVCVFQVTELECVSGQTTAIKTQKSELNRTVEELEEALKAKEEVRTGRHDSALKSGSRLVPVFTISVNALRNWRG